MARDYSHYHHHQQQQRISMMNHRHTTMRSISEEQQQQQQQPQPTETSSVCSITNAIVDVNEAQQCCDPSVATNSSLSSISTDDDTTTTTTTTATTTTTTTPSIIPFDIEEPHSLLRHELECFQINHTSPGDNNHNSSSGSVTTTTVTPNRHNDTTFTNDACNGTVTASQHHIHNSNMLLQELILVYPMNVVSYPHRKLEYEEQICTIAKENPNCVNTYNQPGYTPFHIACQTGGVSLRIIKDLFYINPIAITAPTQSFLRPHRRRHRRRQSSRTNTRTVYFNPPSSSSSSTMLPLHLACRYYSGREQYDIIEFLLQMYPEAAQMWTMNNNNNSENEDDNTSSDGNDLPIHLYCQNHFCNLSVVQLLLHAYPESIQKVNHPNGKLPLHIVCERRYFQRVYNTKYDDPKTTIKGTERIYSNCCTSDDLVRYFIPLYPQSVMIRDVHRGEIPFHTAIRGYQTLSTLRYILSYCHSSPIVQTDIKGRTPLHRYCMMWNDNNSDTNDEILLFLLRHDTDHMAGTIQDQKGCTPLQHLLQRPDVVSLDIIYTLLRHYPTSIQRLLKEE